MIESFLRYFAICVSINMIYFNTESWASDTALQNSCNNLLDTHVSSSIRIGGGSVYYRSGVIQSGNTTFLIRCLRNQTNVSVLYKWCDGKTFSTLPPGQTVSACNINSNRYNLQDSTLSLGVTLRSFNVKSHVDLDKRPPAGFISGIFSKLMESVSFIPILPALDYYYDTTGRNIRAFYDDRPEDLMRVYMGMTTTVQATENSNRISTNCRYTIVFTNHINRMIQEGRIKGSDVIARIRFSDSNLSKAMFDGNSEKLLRLNDISDGQFVLKAPVITKFGSGRIEFGQYSLEFLDRTGRVISAMPGVAFD